ncbi:MAG: hypothetical protein KAQ65_10690 [Candidatus Thorarchaeota archaeon]|nr:hypothetical protein [Candidatus Thorarchaeota archaeon]MCK5239225.1 hypothetical protein [Candidatus Thorarchaeota archaeon]
MESLEATGIHNYLREKRLKTLKNLMTLNGRYNLFLNELREQRGEIADQRKKGEIGLKKFWDMRMNLEDRIQDIERKRDEVVKQIVAIFPKTR